MATKESGEELIGTTNDLDSANALRYHLARRGVRLWMFVEKTPEGTYNVSAASEWCGRLPEETVNMLREEAQRFIDVQPVQVQNEPASTGDDVIELVDDVAS